MMGEFGAKLIGDSPAFQATLRSAAVIAATDVTVLIQGESGTGKDLLANALHAASRRAGGPLVAINCAALPETLAESELFGHKKGAFTSAVTEHPGRIRAAAGGTLFLDEVAELPLSLQAKLLRFLETGECQPVGDTRVVHVDTRVIAATHQDLHVLVQAGRFREDLYYRLNVVPIHSPPLRERREDIPDLVRAFLEEACARNGRRPMTIAPEALTALEGCEYKGNVRELRNLVERLAILSDGPELTLADVEASMPVASRAPNLSRFQPGKSFHEQVADAEREIILAALARTKDNVTEAARMLGLERGHFYKKMKALGLRRGSADSASTAVEVES